MDRERGPVPCTIMVVDVESYGDLTRTDRHRRAVRDGMYSVLKGAFGEADIPWARCRIDDAGDGVLVLVPADVPKIELVDRMVQRLGVGLRRHNVVHSDGARMRLRIALHSGEAGEDQHGFVGEAINFTFRLSEAPEAKLELKESTADFVIIVSDLFFRTVVANDPAADPTAFWEINVSVKETQERAWTRLVGGQSGRQRTATEPRRSTTTGQLFTLAELGKIVDVLAETPGFATQADRDLVLDQLDANLRSAIYRHAGARADITSIVRTCQRYAGGWENLIEAIRFFSAGSHAMSRLDHLLGEISRAGR